MTELERFTGNFTDKQIFEIKNSEKIDNKFLFMSDEVKRIVQKINKKTFTAGLILGEMRGIRFFPSAPLIDIIAKHTDKKIIVNKKTAWLYLCGRDIFAQGIVKATASTGFVIVENELGEALGYGQVLGKTEEKNRVVVKNLFDKGVFLRKERKR